MPRAKSKEPQKAGGISDQAVEKATGQTWKHWFALLNQFDVKSQGHAAAARFLKSEHALSPWWSQMIVVGYEQAHGLREKHQKTDGYSISATKTIAVSAEAAFETIHEAKPRSAWLPRMNWTIRGATRPKSLRILLPDQTTLEIGIVSQGPRKCQVSFQQNRLPSRELAQKQKAFWQAKAIRLKEVLENESN